MNSTRFSSVPFVRVLLAALGTCTAMTVQLYAQRKKWPLAGVNVRLTHQRVHYRDCEECEEKEGYLDRVEKEITLRGPLDDAQVQRLAEIAERCPVNRTLRQSVQTVQEVRLDKSAAPEMA